MNSTYCSLQTVDAITAITVRIRQHRARATIISPERRHLTRDGRLRAAAGPRRRFGAKEE